MQILIVEDDRDKERQLTEAVRGHFPDAGITARRSYQSGLKEVRAAHPEVVLLDMSIPTFDVDLNIGETGGRPRPYGGRDMLREIARRKLSSRVIIVTQYDFFEEGQDVMTLDELRVSLAEQFPKNYVSTVLYHASRSDWRLEIVDAVKTATTASEES